MFFYKKSESRIFKWFTNVYFFQHTQLKNIDTYNMIFFSLNGILIWLNILHINIIIVKYSFLILLNNLEYLILPQCNYKYIFEKRISGGRGERGREREEDFEGKGRRFAGRKSGKREEETGRKKRDERKDFWEGKKHRRMRGKNPVYWRKRGRWKTVLKNKINRF